MATYKKTIVLNNSKSSTFNGSAVLTLNQNGSGVYGTLKTFNITNSPNLVLGVAQNKKQVFKQNINLINNNSYSFKLNSLNLDENISCVLVLDEPDKVIPLIWGSDNKNELKQEIIENLSILKNQHQKTETLNNKLNLDEMFDLSDAENIIDSYISNDTPTLDFIPDTPIAEINLTNVKAELSTINTNASTFSNTNNIIEEELDKLEIEPNQTFFEAISDQVEDLFNSYPSEPHLEDLIPNSKWVKIDYENNGNFYVLGLIYEDISLKYVCYGVPGEYSETPPAELDGYSQWLPLDLSDPENNGYWVVYQDALTGESVLIDAI